MARQTNKLGDAIMGGFLSFLKELNGFKYVFALAMAVVGSWYDLKTDVRILTERTTVLKERDAEQAQKIESLQDNLLAEIRLLRIELANRRNENRK